MLEQLIDAGEFRQATQLMNTVITVLNQDSSQVTRPDSSDFENRVEVGGNIKKEKIKRRETRGDLHRLQLPSTWLVERTNQRKQYNAPNPKKTMQLQVF